ncbi:hypothetical protein ACFP2T_47550 [Plantactinospora solaniradicis]|uniref:OmpR/PhoB-type domain-containing protein n=1 Tax=Plantactinospora solaniradicis TaxID=1723736 RepID=A0ABW1KT07_9ACTN
MTANLEALRFGRRTVELDRHRVLADGGGLIVLTRMEWGVLRSLACRPGQLVPQHQVIAQVGDCAPSPAAIHRLRQYVAVPCHNSSHML